MASLSTITFIIALIPTVAAIILAFLGFWIAFIVLIYIASSGLIVSFSARHSVASQTTWLLGKGQDGRIALWSYFLFAPYHLALHIKLHVGSLITSEPRYSEITPGWHLGGYPALSSHLPPTDPSVVDVTCELPRTHQSPSYCLIPVWDTAGPTFTQLSAAAEFCKKERASGRAIYVHCAHGHGRSACVMIAALVYCGLATGIDVALTALQNARPKVRLTSPQRQALDAWMDKHASRDDPHGPDQKECIYSHVNPPVGSEESSDDMASLLYTRSTV